MCLNAQLQTYILLHSGKLYDNLSVCAPGNEADSFLTCRFGVRLASLKVWTDGKVLPAGLQRNRYIHLGNAMSLGRDP